MAGRVVVNWICRPCQVEGQDPPPPGSDVPACWNCGGPIVVTARPTVPVDSTGNHLGF